MNTDKQSRVKQKTYTINQKKANLVTVSGDNPSQEQQGQETIKMAPGGRSGGRGRGGNARGYNKGRGYSKFTKSNK